MLTESGPLTILHCAGSVPLRRHRFTWPAFDDRRSMANVTGPALSVLNANRGLRRAAETPACGPSDGTARSCSSQSWKAMCGLGGAR